ncbi:hypothetical protein B7Y94_01115 [Candidatus Saccharibacteria bacterium 32-49-12]|nr:MAG: hypothetical protein B7Y94_01115 [Candidatus Saccharibacteria bacterium 32-49-12]
MNDAEQIQNLTSYITSCRQQNISDDNTRQALLGNGWSEAMINRAFSTLDDNGTSSAALAKQFGPKYSAGAALRDAFNAIAKSPVAFIVAVVLYIGGIALIAALLAAVFQNLTSLLSSSALPFAGFILLPLAGSAPAVGMYIMNSLLATALSYIGVSYKNQVTADIKTMLGLTIRRLGRVILANIMVAIAVAGPIVLLFTLVAVMAFTSIIDLNSAAIIVSIVGFASIIWMVVAFFRYALVTYIAINEPNLPVIKTLGRSHRLLSSGGYSKILGLIIYAVGISLMITLLTAVIQSELVASIALGFFTAVYAVATTMIYLWRVEIKD